MRLPKILFGLIIAIGLATSVFNLTDNDLMVVEHTCEVYFNSWEMEKDQGTLGMFWILSDNDYLIFVKEGEAVALHEVGHLVNVERGYPSRSPEFEAAVIEYLSYCTEQPCWRINYFYEQGQLDEIYSEFYMWDILYSIPQEFEVFYAR